MSQPEQPDATPPAGDPAPSGGGGVSPDARNMAMLAHLLGLIGFLGPLLIWLLKKDDDQFIDDQGKEALNFQLTLLIGYLIGGVLTLILIGILVVLALGIMHIVFAIMGALKAKEGIAYRYPICIRFLS